MYLKRCTLVSSLSVALFGAQLKVNEAFLKETEQLYSQSTSSEQLYLKLDNWIHFKVSNEVNK